MPPVTTPQSGNLNLFANFANGNAIKGLGFKVTDTLGTVHTGNLDSTGKHTLSGLPTGPTTVQFGNDLNDPWESASYHGKPIWPLQDSVINEI